MRLTRILLVIVAVVCFGVALSYPIRYRLAQNKNDSDMDRLSAMRLRAQQAETAAPGAEPETTASVKSEATESVEPAPTASVKSEATVSAEPQAGDIAVEAAQDDRPERAAVAPELSEDATGAPEPQQKETEAPAIQASGVSAPAGDQTEETNIPAPDAERTEEANITAPVAQQTEEASASAPVGRQPEQAKGTAPAVPDGQARPEAPGETTPAQANAGMTRTAPEAISEPEIITEPDPIIEPEPASASEPMPAQAPKPAPESAALTEAASPPEPTRPPEPTPSPEPTPTPTPGIWELLLDAYETPTPTPRVTLAPRVTPTPEPTPVWDEYTGPLPYPMLEKVALDEGAILPELREIYELNHDLVGWIVIPDTVIDYPVVQTKDSEFYLDHDFYGEENINGQIILDTLCDPYTPSYNLIISGHHMKNGSMFGNLPEYRTKGYWERHRFLEFDTLMFRKQYVVFAAFYSADYDEDEAGFRYNANIQYAMEAKQWLKEIEDNRLYETGVDVQFGDEFLTLTTCNRARHRNGRFVVVCRKIREGETFE